MSSKGTTLSRLAAGIAVDVGILTTLTPAFATRLYQVPAEQATGAARFGLRLFGVRNVMIGGAALAGNEQAKTINTVAGPSGLRAIPRTTLTTKPTSKASMARATPRRTRDAVSRSGDESAGSGAGSGVAAGGVGRPIVASPATALWG